MGECALCGDAKHETAWVTTLGADVCLRCYIDAAGHRPAPDHLHGCPACGDRVAPADGYSGRYGSEGICWPCFVARHPELARAPRRKRKRDPFVALFDQVWDWMEADGCATTTGAGPVTIAGYCPRCRNTMVARFYDAPLDVGFECRGDCTEAQIAALLGRRNAA